MICKLLRPMQVANPEYNELDRLTAIQQQRPYRIPRDIWLEKGAEISDPQAWMLVLVGVAEPVDKECQEASGNPSDNELTRRILNYEKVDRGMSTGKVKFDGDGEPGKRIPAGMDLGTAGIEIATPDSGEEEDEE